MFDPRIITESIAQYLRLALRQHARSGREILVTCKAIGDIETTIDEALGLLAGEGYFSGCCVAVKDPDLLPEMGAAVGGVMRARYMVEVWTEHLANNSETGSGYSAGAWAMQVHEALTGLSLSHLANSPTLHVMQSSSGSRDGRPGAQGYAVTVEAVVAGGTSSVPTAPTLAVSEDGTVIGLSCDWPTNARIYYSLSEDHAVWPALPGPDVTGAVRYSEPIVVDPAAGYALLAIAYGPGSNADWLPSKTITRRIARPSGQVIDYAGNAITDGDGNVIGMADE